MAAESLTIRDTLTTDGGGNLGFAHGPARMLVRLHRGTRP